MQLLWIVALGVLNLWLLSRLIGFGKAQLTTAEQWQQLIPRKKRSRPDAETAA